MKPEWFCVSFSGAVVRRCRADDKASAIALLAPRASEHVQSGASYSVPVPRAVRACQGGVRACRCGSVKGMAPWSDYCQACRTAHQRKARQAKPVLEPLSPAVVREGREHLERLMAESVKPVGRPRKVMGSGVCSLPRSREASRRGGLIGGPRRAKRAG